MAHSRLAIIPVVNQLHDVITHVGLILFAAVQTSCPLQRRYDLGILLSFQAAFKKAASSNSEETAAGVQPGQVEDWDAVKAEDRTLVHQVSPQTHVNTIVSDRQWVTLAGDLGILVTTYMTTFLGLRDP